MIDFIIFNLGMLIAVLARRYIKRRRYYIFTYQINNSITSKVFLSQKGPLSIAEAMSYTKEENKVNPLPFFYEEVSKRDYDLLATMFV